MIDHRSIIDFVRGSGHRSCTCICTVNPKNFFCCCCHSQPFYISRVSFFLFFFLLYSSVAQTLKNVGPLGCNLRLLRRRSLGGKISVAEVMLLLTLNVFSANFRVVLVVVAFFFHFNHSFSLFLSFFLSFSLWWLGTFLFFLVEIVSESTLIETSFARQSMSSLPSRPRVTAPWVRELAFSVPTVFKAIENGVDRAKACLVPLKKKTWAWGMSPNLKFHTSANPRTCTEQKHESNRMFLDEPWRLGHCFQSSCLLPLSFVIHAKVSLWLAAVDRFRWHLSIPQRRSWKCIRRPSTLSVSQGTGGSLFPSVRATRSNTVSVRLGNVKLGLDSKKRKPTSYLEVWTQKKLSVEGTDYIHFTACPTHSMFRALFGVPHLFARELLMNSPHWRYLGDAEERGMQLRRTPIHWCVRDMRRCHLYTNRDKGDAVAIQAHLPPGLSEVA